MACLLLALPFVLASGSPVVFLLSPRNGNISEASSITFMCNASDDGAVESISLYNNIGGAFGLRGTRHYRRLANDSNATLLCHFDGSYACDQGEAGASSSTRIVQGKMMQGVEVNESDTLKYTASGNILMCIGTLEFWVKVGFNPASESAYLFATSESDGGRLEIYTDSGSLYSELFDEDGSSVRADAEIDSWLQGEWHHIAVVWDADYGVENGEIIDMFLDGSDGTTSVVNSNFSQCGQPGQFIYLGGNSDGMSQSNSVFDEFRISDRPRLAAEILSSYQNVIASHKNESANWTVPGIADDSYIWSCMAYDNESQAAWNSSNYTLVVDVTTPPSLNSIRLSPSSSGALDPGVTVNVTANITDPSGVDVAMLQYKYDVSWINVTMGFGQGLWNASFKTIGSERTYYYRVWRNDTLGHSNTSRAYAANVTWDYTWVRSPAYLSAYGMVDSVDEVGMLYINNTGDDTLIFTLSNDWPILGVCYNSTQQFSLAPKAVKSVNVTAKYAVFDSSSNMTITISAAAAAPGKSASPASAATMVAMNSYSGGPYLYVDITEHPISVEQGDSGINLTATVRNIGNETAQGVWFNWTLPAGWTNTSGSLNVHIGSMSPQLPANSSAITVTVTSSAPNGIATICINANGSGNVSGFKCINVGVSCSNEDGVCGSACSFTNDDDCPASGGGYSGPAALVGGSGGGIAIIGQEFGISMEAPARLHVYRGGTKTFRINISNIGRKTAIRNISMSIAGHPLTFIKIMPQSISRLDYGAKKSFEVEITIPNYTAYGRYDLSLNASGSAVVLNTSANATHVESVAGLALFVHSLTENETLGLLAKAGNLVGDMAESGFNVEQVSAMLEQARAALAGWDYDMARRLSEDIAKVRGTAFDVHSLIMRVGESIGEADSYAIETPESRKMYELSLLAFERGDYERAEERANRAMLASSMEIGGRLVTARFLQQNWAALAAAGVAIFFVAVAARRKARLIMLKRSIESLKMEELAIRGMMKELQKSYFGKGVIERSEYLSAFAGHRKRLACIRKEVSMLLSRRSGHGGIGKVTRDLGREMSRIKRLIEENQRSYFERGGISKSAYEDNELELKAELEEIEKDMKKRRGGGSWAAAAAVLSVMLLAAGAHAADVTQQESALAAMAGAEAHMAEMVQMGFGIARANDTLREAGLLYSRGDFPGAESIANYVEYIKEKAVEADALIDRAEAVMYDLESQGADTSAAGAVLEQGLDAFDAEMYEDAGELLKKSVEIAEDIDARFSMERASEKASQESIIGFLGRNAPLLLLSAVIALAAVAIAYKATGARRKARRLASLQAEREAIEDSIRSLQKKYFEKGGISKREYRTAMERHKAGLVRVKKALAVLDGGRHVQ